MPADRLGHSKGNPTLKVVNVASMLCLAVVQRGWSFGNKLSKIRL